MSDKVKVMESTESGAAVGAELDRRGFFRLVGAASLPFVAQGCGNDELGENHRFERLRALNLPAEFDVEVWRAKKNQAIVASQELLSIDTDLAQDLEVGDQCRVIRDDGNLALYTVAEVRGESGNNRVRMGMAARCRLGTTNTFGAILSTTAVAQGLSEAEAKAQDEYIEVLVDDGLSDSLVVIAPHGGWIEMHTDDQAQLVQSLLAGKGASAWIGKGYKQGGGSYNRWHITSTALSRNSFPGLDAIADRGFAYALSFHGMSHEAVVVGGGAPPELRELVVAAVAEVLQGSGIEVSLAHPDDRYAGDDPANVVNWLTADGVGGVQIEQSLRAREVYGLDIAAAVAGVFDTLI